MKKLIALLAVLSFLLLSCSPPGGPGSHAIPSHVAIGGAHGLYLQGRSISKSVHSRAISSPSALLMLLNADATSAPAEYTDAQGQPVTVTINRSLQLDAAYLLIDYTAEGGQGIAVVTIADGTMRELATAPDNWDRVRVKAGTAYFVAGGHLQKMDLATLSALDISQGDVIGGGSLVFLDPFNNVHTFNFVNGSIDPANQVRIYFADGSPVDTLNWGSVEGLLLCEQYGSKIFEDDATGRVWYITSGGGGGLVAQEFLFDAAGVFAQTPVMLDASFIDAGTYLLPAARKAFLGNVAVAGGTGATGTDKLASLAVDGSGTVTGISERVLRTYAQPTVYRSGKVYTADALGVNVIELSTGINSQIVNAPGITAVEVVADAVYFSTPSGVYQRDAAGTVTLYSAVPVDIVPVTEP